jgi:hypothetical protein
MNKMKKKRSPIRCGLAKPHSLVNIRGQVLKY